MNSIQDEVLKRADEELRRKFRLKKDHIKLLKNMEFKMIRGGGDLVSIGVEGKRPFGNSYVMKDIADILGWKYDADDDLSQKQLSQAQKLFRELPLALNRILKKL